ncbi:hypothetical protein COM33_29025 [Bacillus toyonensis]|uniref:hypothetical protein n=1 Tax=Bacillus TaxID=1386 RepID=UPI0002795DAE|nr:MULTISPECIES: hypothetical protein [Bacillus]KNH39351.1 hypothetical protein ACS75_17480 [Bacillus thuringiensis]KXY14686.1 hypothetical protein AT259_08485 [Bacillus cereus]MDH8704152.1 hypothetical protein [Stenotrophomonas sp. 1198]AHA10528.1 hypothetical protein Btoyo_4659 [Bacillus toyonensis BCT-7112]EJQ89344.1 hypothetical protein IGO_01840 [Bacillus toyonensis]
MNHRRKKNKPKQIRKESVQIKPIVEEKPLKKSSNKLVDILLGILLFPIFIWAVLEGSTTQVSKGKTFLIIVFFILIAIRLSMIGNK